MKDYLSQLVRRSLLEREPNLGHRVSIEACRLLLRRLYASGSRNLNELRQFRRVAIAAASDNDPNLFRQLQWGDFWFKYELTKALGQLGYLVVNLGDAPDVIVHLYGQPAKLSPKAYKIIWIHSHPEDAKPTWLRTYDRVFCISSTYSAHLRSQGIECTHLGLATAKLSHDLPIARDIAFVGNAREDGARKIVEDIGATSLRFGVWGGGYRSLAPGVFQGDYVDYTSIDLIYGASCISLNDHRPSMAEHGFLNPRIYDILASGGFCISDKNPGIREVFGDSVPQYESPNHLREIVDYYIRTPEMRLAAMKVGASMARKMTWVDLVQQLLRGISTAFD